MRSWEEKINGETEEKKMNRQADFTDGSSSLTTASTSSTKK